MKYVFLKNIGIKCPLTTVFNFQNMSSLPLTYNPAFNLKCFSGCKYVYSDNNFKFYNFFSFLTKSFSHRFIFYPYLLSILLSPRTAKHKMPLSFLLSIQTRSALVGLISQFVCILKSNRSCKEKEIGA